MELTILSGKISWFGKNSGYDVLTDYLLANNYVKIIKSGNSIVGRFIGKIFQKIFKWNSINTQDTYTGIRFILNTNPNKISHILHIESHLQVIGKIPHNKKNVIGTIHLPFNQWQQNWLNSLSKFSHAIILYEQEVNLFSKYLPINRIHFIRHGINTSFFKPLSNKQVIKSKVLIVGHYLRNFEMLLKVYDVIVQNIINLEFHIIIPEIYRNTEALSQMTKNTNVFFYQKLSDEELLEQYQTTNILLLPMDDSGANSAIVQAMAVGLPIITTDVGGIRSYGGGQIFPVVENDNIEEMVVLFKKYYYDSDFRNTVSTNIRKFAVENLDWQIISQQHLDLYKTIQKNN